jgi:hypothetical protein
MKQTAVEFLVKNTPNIYWEDAYWTDLFEQAKEMEKQQIIDAYEDGYSDSDNTFKLNEQYYKETFNK